MPNWKWSFCVSLWIVIQSSPKRQSKFNIKRTLSDDSIFYPLAAPLRWFFSNSVPIQSELIHSVKSLIEKATTSASSRASQIGSQQTEKKNACRQILREMVKAQEIRNDFRRSQKRGCERLTFFFCKENHRKLHEAPLLIRLSFHCTLGSSSFVATVFIN